MLPSVGSTPTPFSEHRLTWDHWTLPTFLEVGVRSLPAREAQSSMAGVEGGGENLVLEGGPPVSLETSSLVASGDANMKGKPTPAFGLCSQGDSAVWGHISPDSTWPLPVTQVDKSRSF